MPRVSFRLINVEQLRNAVEVLDTVGAQGIIRLYWGNEGLLVKIDRYFDTREREDTCFLTLLHMTAESLDYFECTGPYACNVLTMTQIGRILRFAPAGFLISLEDPSDIDDDDDDDDDEDDDDEYDDDDECESTVEDPADEEEERAEPVVGGLTVTFEPEEDEYVETTILTSVRIENDYEFEEIDFVKRVQIQPDVFRNSLRRLTGLGTVYISTNDQEVHFLEKPTNEVVVLDAEDGECIVEVEDGVDSEMQLVGLCPAFQDALIKATAFSDRIELLGARNGGVALEFRIPDLGCLRFCEAETP